MAVDGWAVTFGTEEGSGRAAAPPSPLLAVSTVTPHPSTASVPSLYCCMMVRCSVVKVVLMWRLKG